MANCQPAILLFLGDRDRLSLNRTSHDCPDRTGHVLGLLQERGISERLIQSPCRMGSFDRIIGIEPLSHQLFKLRTHDDAVIAPDAGSAITLDPAATGVPLSVGV